MQGDGVTCFSSSNLSGRFRMMMIVLIKPKNVDIVLQKVNPKQSLFIPITFVTMVRNIHQHQNLENVEEDVSIPGHR